MVIMPTGGGKSVCYQIPALMMPGCAVVVSPLIALMTDQVVSLQANGYPAEAVNSFNTEKENIEIFGRASRGETKLIYISPERFLTDIERLSAKFPFSFMAIDEAHCISQWGHDFRPDYTGLSRIRDKYPELPVMALTATADAVTRDDIATQLKMRDPQRYIASFNRPNISLAVMPSPSRNGKLREIKQLYRKHPNDSGIVYCLSRNTTEEVALSLRTMGVEAYCYHAGMSQASRTEIQHKFINGEIPVIVATIAFGMGIDKSNIRWIVHYNLPANIESYYQEIGRAGRDGMPAEALLFYNYQDVILREKLIAESDHSEVFRTKLNIMKSFAEARVCRRRILLSYFNEEATCDCGNCDVCLNPPEFFDGTKAAQMAMSAIVRAGGRLAMNTLVDILRGNLTANVRMYSYQDMPTFGVGREYSAALWKALIGQIIQLGIIETHINDYGRLSITPYGRRILFGHESVNLVIPDIHSMRRETGARTDKAPAIPVSREEALLEQLKSVRRTLSRKNNIPDYIICSDASLADMVARHPLSVEAFSNVAGIGEVKAVKYWRPFVSAIMKFDGMSESLKGANLRETLILHNAGYRPTEAAKLRNIKLATIYSQYAELITEGLITSFERIIPQSLMDFYLSHRDSENWFEIVNDRLPDGLWRVARAIAEQKKL